MSSFIDHEIYRDKEIGARLEQDAPGLAEAYAKNKIKRSADPTIQYLYNMCNYPTLSREQEKHMFQQLNYFRYRATITRGVEHIRVTQKALAIRNELLQCNIRLIVNFLKQKPTMMHDVMESINRASIIVLRAIDKFDWSRGFKFSTYVTWAILRGCAKELIPDTRNNLIIGKHGKEIASIIDTEQTKLIDHHPTPIEEIEIECLKDAFQSLLTELEKRDKRAALIIKARNGIDCQPQSLIAIARRLKISKERVRQIQQKNMKILRLMAKNRYPSLVR